MSQVDLNKETRRRWRCRSIADDVGHCAVAQGLVILPGINPVLISL